jgi:hypothetical protein
MPQVERREARASDRKEAQHAGRTVSHLVCGVQSGYASRSRGFARPGVWAALRSFLFGERGEAAQARASMRRENERGFPLNSA